MKHLMFVCLLFAGHEAYSSPSIDVSLFAERPLLKFHGVPAQAEVGQGFSIFVQADTLIEKNEYVLQAQVNASPIDVVKTGDQVWVIHFKPFLSVAENSLSVDIFIKDQKEATRLRETRDTLNQEISDLVNQIAIEPNLQKKSPA